MFTFHSDRNSVFLSTQERVGLRANRRAFSHRRDNPEDDTSQDDKVIEEDVDGDSEAPLKDNTSKEEKADDKSSTPLKCSCTFTPVGYKDDSSVALEAKDAETEAESDDILATIKNQNA